MSNQVSAGRRKHKRSAAAEEQRIFERDAANSEVVRAAVDEYMQRCEAYERFISPPDGVPRYEGDGCVMAVHSKNVIIQLMQKYRLDYFVLHRGIHHYQAQQDKARRLKR